MGISIVPTNDFEFFDAVVNHPSIRGRVLSDSQLWDQTTWKVFFEQPGTRCLKVQDTGFVVGCFLGLLKSPGVYEIHSFLFPEGRGKSGLEAGRLAIEWMWNVIGAHELFGLVPVFLPEAVLFNRRLGFKIVSREKDSWLHEGRYFDCVKMQLKGKV